VRAPATGPSYSSLTQVIAIEQRCNPIIFKANVWLPVTSRMVLG
jgi:hypothetical protein